MTASVDVLFDQGLDVFGAVVAEIPAEAWDRPTPCEGWTSLDVLGHLGSSIGFGISVLQGQQPTWPEADRPADLVSGEPAAYWQAIADRARSALEGADLDLEMDTPMGRRTIGDRLAFPAVDLYVHAWDIGTTAGVPVVVPADVIELAHRHIDPFPEDVVRGPQGSFGPEVEPPDDATDSERFLAWTGRDPRAARST